MHQIIARNHYIIIRKIYILESCNVSVVLSFPNCNLHTISDVLLHKKKGKNLHVTHQSIFDHYARVETILVY